MKKKSTKKNSKGKPLATIPVMETINIDIRLCDRNKDNKRELYGDITWLTQSIDTNGIIQVMWGKRSKENPGRVLILDGNRRLFAAWPLLQNNKRTIMADVRIVPDHYTLADIMKLQVLVNTVKPYENFENAKVVKDLMEEHDYGKVQIRKEFNWTPQYVDSLCIYNMAPEHIQKLVREERLSLYELMRLYKDEQYAKDFINISEVVLEAAELVSKEPEISKAPPLKGKKSKNGSLSIEFVEERNDRGEINEPSASWSPPPGHDEPAPSKKSKGRKSEKITKKHIDAVEKKKNRKPVRVNSFTELWKFIEENKDLVAQMSEIGKELLSFIEGVRDDKFTAEDFPKLFFGDKV